MMVSEPPSSTLRAAPKNRFGRFEVDLVDLDEGEVALTVLGGPDLAFHRVTGVQVEASDLARRYVDVVGAGEVGRIGRTQEAEAVRQHLHHAIAVDRLAFFGPVLQQREDQFLLAQAVGAFDVVGNGHFEQLADVEGLELRELHGRQRWGEGESKGGRTAERVEMCALTAERRRGCRMACPEGAAKT